MEYISRIGVNTPRKEAWDKVTGAAKYNGDTTTPNILHAKMLTSPHAHAIIKSIDTSEASKATGVQAVITGEYYSVLSGSVIEDRPPIAKDKVRYFGEPVAVVVANSEDEAMRAVKLIKVVYDPLPVVNSIGDSIKPSATLIHENLGQYHCTVEDVYPKPNSNIADHVKIRKGNMSTGWEESDVIMESSFSLPQSDHIAMETRNAKAQILPDGNVIIYSSSQAPFSVKKRLSKLYNIPEGNVIVRVPLVGGAFGGKATVQLEFIAYLASKAVGGRMVKIANSREEDITTSPSKIGIEAKLKIGTTKDGLIKALECTYHVDCGAYADTGPRMAKAIAVDCTSPYNIENVWCDVFTVYTNHTYVTSYRGFGHGEFTFCIERMLNKVATSIGIDPLELRMKNAIYPGNLSPTQDKITLSNTGNLPSCISKLKEVINWQEGTKIELDNGMIRAKGVSCFWKTSDSPTNASSGVIITLNTDGSVNLNFSAVEIGPGMKTTIAQIFAEKMKMDINKVYVVMNVDTQTSPKHWKTVASMTTFMVGNAVIDAAEDLIRQLREIGAIVLKCTPKDLEVENERVYLRDDPEIYVTFKDLVYGYEYPGGTSIGGQMIGRGSYIMKHLTKLDKETGKGKAGVSWTVGAQAVEIEYDPKKYTYRLLKAATVIDVGKVINPKTARGLIMGGMSMGLGLATREELLYNDAGILENTSLRTYKPIHYGQNPQYIVDFIETPQIDAPFGARGMGEHGILGISAAFANAISLAAQSDFDKLPISPELIWKTKTGGKYDPL
ncbi:molybdopterin-binding domain of aldehyde dehydrogenase family protein [Clostridium argentinense CDC 2741]|uniref:Molybdopterin-binding domain of aldehyde dehydrogenase family protein n=1 Tax=Clostridium argentinense CDC 2741 TaxID=1418104 RepID=A0A0C1UDD0_9CLOT|nr:xanthine dehydrogenase family protein molybdopterin-binding subunit [Clostridium argentinense]ARC86819.1 aldehyde oxidase [Clostridium argentinense]KIE45460.1 molybdopterin-binding domain of aldehyde dehydrogenase family protein [Clostridium argentinense CDC 2741]NFF38568.1 xanthine dehydrogenase family protein molybdopterin-binding subunit [Clostridium argentinense]NFP51688.1 xanthine dehydrogenase family protein molybdopterin-binding subunit [Clostridium argentinense]NFP74013.1 xanthine d